MDDAKYYAPAFGGDAPVDEDNATDK